MARLGRGRRQPARILKAPAFVSGASRGVKVVTVSHRVSQARAFRARHRARILKAPARQTIIATRILVIGDAGRVARVTKMRSTRRHIYIPGFDLPAVPHVPPTVSQDILAGPVVWELLFQRRR